MFQNIKSSEFHYNLSDCMYIPDMNECKGLLQY